MFLLIHNFSLFHLHRELLGTKFYKKNWHGLPQPTSILYFFQLSNLLFFF